MCSCCWFRNTQADQDCDANWNARIIDAFCNPTHKFVSLSTKKAELTDRKQGILANLLTRNQIIWCLFHFKEILKQHQWKNTQSKMTTCSTNSWQLVYCRSIGIKMSIRFKKKQVINECLWNIFPHFSL